MTETTAQQRLRAKRSREARAERAALDAAHDREFAEQLRQAEEIAAEANPDAPRPDWSDPKVADPSLRDEFFDATPELQTIYRWARARYAAPWAVLGAVLLRVVATVGPHVQLPGVIGGRASLNLLAAFVAPSGGGKGISDSVARLVWPAALIERPIGSGEGLAATFADPRKEDVERVTRAIITVPEIDTLAGIASRQGSILLAQLKSLAMGEQLGQGNATEATSRIVPAHTYRACLSVGAQPTHTGVIFNDTTGGTPQRFLWFPTTDPTMPADATPDPEPLDTSMPFWSPGPDGVVEIGYGPPEIRGAIIAAHIARQRGETDALDGHAMLTRLKVAAALALLHKRTVVSALDWSLSAQVMAVSDHTRQWVLDETKKASRAQIRDRALARAAGEEVVDERRAEVVRRRVLKVLESGALSWSDTRSRMGKKEYRELFDGAVATLAEEGVVSVLQSDRGRRLELNRQFRDEPEFTPQNHRSEGVNREFRGEPTPAAESTACTPAQPPKDQLNGAVPQVQRVPESEPPVPLAIPRATRCTRCSIDLPAAATTGLCDDCDGAPEPAPAAPRDPAPPLHVIHSEATEKARVERKRAERAESGRGRKRGESA